MSLTTWNEMQSRDAKRCAVEKDIAALKLPPRGCTESKKLFKKVMTQLDNEFEDACFLVTHDFKVMKLALQDACLKANLNINDVIGSAWDTASLKAEEKAELDLRSVAANENPDQIKIGSKDKNGTVDKKGKVKDDGSEAEPASEVKKTKLEKVS